MSDTTMNLLDDNVDGRGMSPMQATRVRDEVVTLRAEVANAQAATKDYLGLAAQLQAAQVKAERYDYLTGNNDSVLWQLERELQAALEGAQVVAELQSECYRLNQESEEAKAREGELRRQLDAQVAALQAAQEELEDWRVLGGHNCERTHVDPAHMDEILAERQSLRAEIERLRGELASLHDEYGDVATPYEKDYMRLQAEVERLRGENEGGWLSYEGAKAQLQAAQEEVERLRGVAGSAHGVPHPRGEPRMTDAETLARMFHEEYERRAGDFGYETRKASAVPWEQVPEDNRRLMVATAAAVLRRLSFLPEGTQEKEHG